MWYDDIDLYDYMNEMPLFSFSVVWSFGYSPTFSAQSLNIIKMKRKWKLRSLLQPSTSANVGGILEFFVQIWKRSQRSNCEGRFPNPDEDGQEEEETPAEASFIKDLVKRRWAASAFPATVFLGVSGSETRSLVCGPRSPKPFIIIRLGLCFLNIRLLSTVSVFESSSSSSSSSGRTLYFGFWSDRTKPVRTFLNGLPNRTENRFESIQSCLLRSWGILANQLMEWNHGMPLHLNTSPTPHKSIMFAVGSVA